MHLLVCGGAGYIGSHLVRRLLADGQAVTVLDNVATGHREAVGGAELIEADLCDADAVDAVLAQTRFDAVLHFAARSLVAESVANPDLYWRNNVEGTANLLAAIRRHGPRRLVFSSTAAVYGNPVSDQIDESHPTRPINPYGETKLRVEGLLAEAAAEWGLRSVSLRYFNAAGASPAGDLGESHTPETHLIPNVLRAALGQGPVLKVFGSDYPTPDGTCVRDYIHVDDLADAHVRALSAMERTEGAQVFNLGNGRGFSVREVIAAAERVTGRAIPYTVEARRAGDPPVLVASAARAQRELGWEPRYTSLDDIVATAWRWHQAPRF